MGERQYLITREELEEAETVGIPFSQKGAANGVATLNGSEELTPSQVPASVEGSSPKAETITRNSSGQITGAVLGTGNLTQTIANVTRSAGQVTSFEQNGVTHTVTRNASGQVTAVS
jgi:hypothetical protein